MRSFAAIDTGTESLIMTGQARYQLTVPAAFCPLSAGDKAGKQGSERLRAWKVEPFELQSVP